MDTKSFIYKWLPIFFGCHCKEERSFHYHGNKFPICARCTGELVGIVWMCSTFGLYRPSKLIAVVIAIPMIVDGLLQLLTNYESTNQKRFLTGVLFGYALTFFVITSAMVMYKVGYSFAANYGYFIFFDFLG